VAVEPAGVTNSPISSPTVFGPAFSCSWTTQVVLITFTIFYEFMSEIKNYNEKSTSRGR
jgi:hypothetical protein